MEPLPTSVQRDLALLEEYRPWIPFLKRLVSASRRALIGYTAITITVIVDQHGQPLYWTPLQRTSLEPRHDGPGELG